MGLQFWPGTAWPRGPSPWRRHMPGTSLGILCLNWATGAPTCWARWWGAMACGTTSSSRAPAGLLSRAEAMAGLGIPATRTLAAVTTGEMVLRDTALPGAVLTRVAASHLRVGTFEYFAARRDTDGLRKLADFAIARHYPEAAQARQPYRALLEGVVARQARLIAQWMLIGFVHGVMNTDNTSISGETIDYGPCAFMEAYDAATVFSSIDHGRRYAYGNQPRAALWNLTRLAEALLPVLELESGSEEAAVAEDNEVLKAFEPQYEAARIAGLRRKLGLFTERE